MLIMSSSAVEDLLNSPEYSDELGDIGAEEEQALLEDDYDETLESQDGEVLDLDSGNIIEEETDEALAREDRFHCERPTKQVEVQLKSPSPIKSNWSDNRNKRSMRGGYRNNNYIQRRNNFQNNTQNKRVLINPHFKGHVPVRNNISLVWDKNLNKKPLIHVHPWAQNPVCRNNSWIQTCQQQPSQQQIHSGYLFPQKIGVVASAASNVFIPPINNQQYIQPIPQKNVQHTFYQQPIYTPQYEPVNGFNQFTQYQNNSATMTSVGYAKPAPFQQPIVQQNDYIHQPRFESLPKNNNFQRNFAVRGENKMVLVDTYRNLAGMGPQARKRFIESRPQTRINLQQVKVADYIPLNTKEPEITIKIEKEIEIEEEDETVKKYRLLIEEQKKLREEILRQKEERRKNAATGGGGDKVPEPLLISNALTNSLKWSKTIENNNVVNEQKNVTGNVEGNSCTSVDKNAITSFLSNRKIIAKDDALPDTSIVVVSNLATGSTEVKLRKLCKGVGDVKNLVISPVERQATIEFKSVASAHTFYKKYQRFMLDLSMIQVVLKKNT